MAQNETNIIKNTDNREPRYHLLIKIKEVDNQRGKHKQRTEKNLGEKGLGNFTFFSGMIRELELDWKT